MEHIIAVEYTLHTHELCEKWMKSLFLVSACNIIASIVK